MLLACAVLLLAEIMDVQAVIPVAPKPAQNKVDAQSRHHGNDHFRDEDARHKRHRHLLGNEDRHHFVRSGQKDREQRTDRDNATGIESRSGSAKAALRNHAEKRADERACFACALHGGFRLFARLVLDSLHRKVGQEQKRHQTQCVLDRMLHDM